MTRPSDINFLGRLEPSYEKSLQNMAYPFSALGLPTAEAVEVELPLPPGLVAHYDQGRIGSCTGASASWETSINNREQGSIKYDFYWLYKRGQATDGDPNTKDDDDGGYVWAVHDVLRKEGHKRTGGAVQLADGIESYYWCKNVDEIRTAFTLGRCPVFGIRWYQNFNTPVTYNNEKWIARAATWGSLLGGHAICCRAASDQRQAVLLRNSWGADYPEVWISYESVTKLLKASGECAVSIDRGAAPTPPPVTKTYIDLQAVGSDGKRYTGRLTEV